METQYEALRFVSAAPAHAIRPYPELTCWTLELLQRSDPQSLAIQRDRFWIKGEDGEDLEYAVTGWDDRVGGLIAELKHKED